MRSEQGFVMPWIVANMKWIMVGSGLLTSTMIYAAISPSRALESTFGESLNGPLIVLVLQQGREYLQHQAGIAVVTDSLMVILFAWYLLASRNLVFKNSR